MPRYQYLPRSSYLVQKRVTRGSGFSHSWEDVATCVEQTDAVAIAVLTSATFQALDLPEDQGPVTRVVRMAPMDVIEFDHEGKASIRQ